MIAQATMERYMDRRSQERKVRSLAQWSRASEPSLSRTREPRSGLERKTGYLAAASLVIIVSQTVEICLEIGGREGLKVRVHVTYVETRAGLMWKRLVIGLYGR